jgi:hypothetical protein
VTRTRLVCLVLAMLAPSIAFAQPTGDVPPQPQPIDPPPVDPPPPGLDEAKVRELIDREVARIIAEREAKLAAERKAADDRAATEGPVRADGDYLSGDNGFMDVRLNFTLTNENLLVKPGETIPSVPGWRFGRPNSLGVLFFDNYDTRFSGYETLSHAVLYKNYRKDHLEAEAGFVLRINELSERRIDFSDAGSYLLVSWWKDKEHNDPTRYTITAFPVSADRMRLGYSYRLSWGGNDEWKGDTNPKPGVKLQYDFARGYAYVGAKSAITLDKPTAEQKSQFAVLGGAGFDVNEMIRVEANGGYFDKGSNELSDVEREDVRMYGASVQVAAHKGMPVQSSVDYKLYKNDPERIGRVFSKTKYPGGLSWLAMSEFTILGQTLKDPAKSGSTKIQWGKAFDVNARVMYDKIRVRFDASFRDLAYLLHTVPSLPAYQDFPVDDMMTPDDEGYEIGPNYFAAVGADINLYDRLTVGATIGIDMPATLTTPNALPGVTELGRTTAVVRNNGTLLITILPEDEDAVPAYAAKFTARLDFGEVFAAIADVYFVRDENATRLVRETPESPLAFTFGEFNQLGMNFTLQARF